MTITMVLILALVIFLFSVDGSWSNVLSTQRNDLVFEGRNQQYGAYSLRREEPKNMFLAMVLTVGLVGGGLTTWMLAGASAPMVEYSDLGSDIYPVPMPAPIPKPEPKKEAKKTDSAPTKKAGGVKNTTPVVVDKTLENPHSDLDKKNKNLGSFDNEDEEDIFKEPKAFEETTGNGKGKENTFVVKDFVKEMPEFPGGDMALVQYIMAHVSYSEIDVARDVQGTMLVSFVINEDGSVSDIKTEVNIAHGEGLSKQAEKAIKNMPLWKPGKDNGKVVKVRRKIPLRFILRS